MDRFVCIHAHLYQPPRENPWLEAIESQPSAYPYHDWNERITAECYAPNGASRVVDERGRIQQIVNNYSRISFNFGPTLLSWMEGNAPEVYASILEADRLSAERFSGHGSAMAQAYNHMILPLANRRDKETQVIWGIRDFEQRFGRMPEGMWLPETAVDLETLEVLAAQGLKFTVLAPSQAARVRRIGGGRFKDVSGAKIDPKRAYMIKLPSGQRFHLFFYDGPISRAVAFEKLLNSGEQFAQRLLSGFAPGGDREQLMHIATDGESYGHHHPHGDMALAYALKYIEDNQLARLTNYGEFLEKYPPQNEVQIIERTAWSCSHGLERWYSDCGCNSGVDWRQQWREPLRHALDWLRDSVAALFEQHASALLRDPWHARNEYIRVLLDRRGDRRAAFFAQNARRELTHEETVTALQLLEMQRHAMLMFTSCGWFFDEISGIETVKVIEYAGRVIQLAQEVIPGHGEELEAAFVARLANAKSNLPEHGDAAQLYRKWVKPAVAGLEKVAAHYAICSLFEQNPDNVPLFCYEIERKDLHLQNMGQTSLALGRIRVCSIVTQEQQEFIFGVIHLGDHNVSAGVQPLSDEAAYGRLVEETSTAFNRSDLPGALRVLDHHFGRMAYSLLSLFSDERKRLLNRLLENTLHEAEGVYRAVYDRHAALLRFLGTAGVERPRILALTAEFVLNANLQKELAQDEIDSRRVKSLMEQASAEGVSLDRPGLGYTLQKTILRLIRRFDSERGNPDRLRQCLAAVRLAVTLGLPTDLWHAQNIFYALAEQFVGRSVQGADPQFTVLFLTMGEFLGIEMGQFERRQQEMHPVVALPQETSPEWPLAG